MTDAGQSEKMDLDSEDDTIGYLLASEQASPGFDTDEEMDEEIGVSTGDADDDSDNDVGTEGDHSCPRVVRKQMDINHAVKRVGNYFISGVVGTSFLQGPNPV
jgi:hypothetical protein